MTNPVQISDAAVQALEALKKAEMFIENGVEYGFIRLPEKPDPALDTLPKIKAAIEALTNEGTKPVDVAEVREAEAVIEQNGEEVTAAAMISVIADFLRENGKAVLLPENSFGKQILEFKLAVDNLRDLSTEPAGRAALAQGGGDE